MGGREGEGRCNLLLPYWRRLHSQLCEIGERQCDQKAKECDHLQKLIKSLSQLCSGNLKWSCWWW